MLGLIGCAYGGHSQQDAPASQQPDAPRQSARPDSTPLADVIDLVSLVYDADGAGSCVMVRYRTAAETTVEPPQWWLDEHASATTPSTHSAAVAGRELLQKVSVHDDPARRVSSRLFPNYDHIRLVRVAPDARSAFFVREVPSGEGASPTSELQEVELFKSTMPLSQDVLAELRRLKPAR